VTRVSVFSSPLLLGFEQFERALDRVAKTSSDGYPPYNVERLGDDHLRIVLAVAGFQQEDILVQVNANQLTVRGKQADDPDGRVYLHRGIASRQFQKSFVLADGIDVVGAALANGLLSIDLKRPELDSAARTIPIEVPEMGEADINAGLAVAESATVINSDARRSGKKA
jgi:HSP20 family molecular chaperone IbpA